MKNTRGRRLRESEMEHGTSGGGGGDESERDTGNKTIDRAGRSWITYGQRHDSLARAEETRRVQHAERRNKVRARAEERETAEQQPPR